MFNLISSAHASPAANTMFDGGDGGNIILMLIFGAIFYGYLYLKGKK